MLKQNKLAASIGALALIAALFLLNQSAKDRVKVPTIDVKMNRHDQQIVQFFTKIIGSQKKTKVYIPFSFEKNTFPLLLGYTTKNHSMNEFLLFHPQISFLDWPQIKENDLTLFQKTTTYKSIADFLKNPSGKIVIDNGLLAEYSTLKATPLENEINLETTDYILTRHIPLKAVGNTFYYENIINTEDALLDDSNQITWVVRAPKADSEHVFFLGNIDITYLQ